MNEAHKDVDADAIDRSLWPDSLIALADAVGAAAALMLCEHHGGTRAWYVARKPKASHPWAQLIGFEAYSALCRKCGGQKIDIPRFAFRTLKKQAILELAASNLPKRQIARQVRCTEGYVQTVLGSAARETTSSRQLNLFARGSNDE